MAACPVSPSSSSFSSFAFLFLFFFFFLCSSPSFSFLFPSPPLSLPYHHGRLLSGDQPIKLYLTFYGEFQTSDRSSLLDFLSSLTPNPLQTPLRSLRFLSRSLDPDPDPDLTPSVAKWWALTQHYRDFRGRHVSQKVEVRGERVDPYYSLGKHLNSSDMASLARSSARAFSVSAGSTNSVLLIFTSADVYVEGFCMHACGGHSFVQLEKEEGDRKQSSEEESDEGGRRDLRRSLKEAEEIRYRSTERGSMVGGSTETKKKGSDMDSEGNAVLYAWVGNAKVQCPGYCAWPLARTDYGPAMEPLKAPNDVGVDGMVITLAKVLVGTATNPFFDGYFQGPYDVHSIHDLDHDHDHHHHYHFGTDASAACLGQFGAGSFPGYPGLLLYNPHTGASFNMEGYGGTQFLVPWIWNPTTLSCSAQA